jgi:hypothetical protein
MPDPPILFVELLPHGAAVERAMREAELFYARHGIRVTHSWMRIVVPY